MRSAQDTFACGRWWCAAAAPSAPSARDRALYHGGIGSDAFFGDGAPEEEDGIAGALSSAFSSLSRLG